MVKSKKVYAKLIIAGCLLIFVLTGCFLFYIGHSAAASAAEALKSETGISLSGDSRLLYAHSKHDFFGEGTHVFVWQLTEEDCKKCWALRQCYLCAKHCDNAGEFSASAKRRHCKDVYNNVEQNFRLYVLAHEMIQRYS